MYCVRNCDFLADDRRGSLKYIVRSSFFRRCSVEYDHTLTVGHSVALSESVNYTELYMPRLIGVSHLKVTNLQYACTRR